MGGNIFVTGGLGYIGACAVLGGEVGKNHARAHGCLSFFLVRKIGRFTARLGSRPTSQHAPVVA